MSVSPETDPADVQTESPEDLHENVRNSDTAVEEPATSVETESTAGPRVSELPEGPEGMRPTSWGRN